jgi:hypothetical protein
MLVRRCSLCETNFSTAYQMLVHARIQMRSLRDFTQRSLLKTCPDPHADKVSASTSLSTLYCDHTAQFSTWRRP